MAPQIGRADHVERDIQEIGGTADSGKPAPIRRDGDVAHPGILGNKTPRGEARNHSRAVSKETVTQQQGVPNLLLKKDITGNRHVPIKRKESVADGLVVVIDIEHRDFEKVVDIAREVIGAIESALHDAPYFLVGQCAIVVLDDFDVLE